MHPLGAGACSPVPGAAASLAAVGWKGAQAGAGVSRLDGVIEAIYAGWGGGIVTVT